MKPKDIIEQIIEDHEGWDQDDVFSFILYKPTFRGKTYNFANISFDKGILELGVTGPDGVSDILDSFALRLLVEPITE